MVNKAVYHSVIRYHILICIAKSKYYLRKDKETRSIRDQRTKRTGVQRVSNQEMTQSSRLPPV